MKARVDPLAFLLPSIVFCKEEGFRALDQEFVEITETDQAKESAKEA